MTTANNQNPVCPGSPELVHAKCEMAVTFPHNTCSEVYEEIMARLTADKSTWVDPHNAGTYTLLGTNDDDSNLLEIQASRTSGGKGLYTDLLGMQLKQESNGCVLSACSESQVTSAIDFSTNYCNLRNLYCDSKEGCSVLKHDLRDYKEAFEACWQRDVSKCIVQTDSE